MTQQVPTESDIERAIFPVSMSIYPEFALFNDSNTQLLFRCHINEGILLLNTPISAIIPISPTNPERRIINLGHITSISENYAEELSAPKGSNVFIEITKSINNIQYIYGEHFDANCELVSTLTREGLDYFKKCYKSKIDGNRELLALSFRLKELFNI